MIHLCLLLAANQRRCKYSGDMSDIHIKDSTKVLQPMVVIQDYQQGVYGYIKTETQGARLSTTLHHQAAMVTLQVSLSPAQLALDYLLVFHRLPANYDLCLR